MEWIVVLAIACSWVMGMVLDFKFKIESKGIYWLLGTISAVVALGVM